MLLFLFNVPLYFFAVVTVAFYYIIITRSVSHGPLAAYIQNSENLLSRQGKRPTTKKRVHAKNLRQLKIRQSNLLNIQ